MSEKTISYQIGRLWGSMNSIARTILCLAAVVAVVGLSSCRDEEKKVDSASTTALVEQRLRETALNARIAMCQTNVSALMERARALASAGDVKK